MRVGVCVFVLSVVYISPFTQLYQGNITLQLVVLKQYVKF